MTVPLTPLAVTALALFRERPMHPYEVYRLLIHRHGGRRVKIRPGSLYHTIDRLAASALVEAVGTDRDGARPERTTYRITEAGHEALQGWIRTELAEPVDEYPRFPVALSEAHNLSRSEAVEHLTARIPLLEAQLAEIEAHLTVAGQEAQEAYLLAAHHDAVIRNAELGWLRSLVAGLETKELAWPSDE